MSGVGGLDSRQYWVDDRFATRCFACSSKFSMLRRRHHCRQCGQIFCGDCLIVVSRDDKSCRSCDLRRKRGESLRSGPSVGGGLPPLSPPSSVIGSAGGSNYMRSAGSPLSLRTGAGSPVVFADSLSSPCQDQPRTVVQSDSLSVGAARGGLTLSSSFSSAAGAATLISGTGYNYSREAGSGGGLTETNTTRSSLSGEPYYNGSSRGGGIERTSSTQSKSSNSNNNKGGNSNNNSNNNRGFIGDAISLIGNIFYGSSNHGGGGGGDEGAAGDEGGRLRRSDSVYSTATASNANTQQSGSGAGGGRGVSFAPTHPSRQGLPPLSSGGTRHTIFASQHHQQQGYDASFGEYYRTSGAHNDTKRSVVPTLEQMATAGYEYLATDSDEEEDINRHNPSSSASNSSHSSSSENKDDLVDADEDEGDDLLNSTTYNSTIMSKNLHNQNEDTFSGTLGGDNDAFIDEMVEADLAQYNAQREARRQEKKAQRRAARQKAREEKENEKKEQVERLDETSSIRGGTKGGHGGGGVLPSPVPYPTMASPRYGRPTHPSLQRVASAGYKKFTLLGGGSGGQTQHSLSSAQGQQSKGQHQSIRDSLSAAAEAATARDPYLSPTPTPRTARTTVDFLGQRPRDTAADIEELQKNLQHHALKFPSTGSASFVTTAGADGKKIASAANSGVSPSTSIGSPTSRGVASFSSVSAAVTGGHSLESRKKAGVLVGPDGRLDLSRIPPHEEPPMDLAYITYGTHEVPIPSRRNPMSLYIEALTRSAASDLAQRSLKSGDIGDSTSNANESFLRMVLSMRQKAENEELGRRHDNTDKKNSTTSSLSFLRKRVFTALPFVTFRLYENSPDARFFPTSFTSELLEIDPSVREALEERYDNIINMCLTQEERRRVLIEAGELIDDDDDEDDYTENDEGSGSNRNSSSEDYDRQTNDEQEEEEDNRRELFDGREEGESTPTKPTAAFFFDEESHGKSRADPDSNANAKESQNKKVASSPDPKLRKGTSGSTTKHGKDMPFSCPTAAATIANANNNRSFSGDPISYRIKSSGTQQTSSSFAYGNRSFGRNVSLLGGAATAARNADSANSPIFSDSAAAAVSWQDDEEGARSGGMGPLIPIKGIAASIVPPERRIDVLMESLQKRCSTHLRLRVHQIIHEALTSDHTVFDPLPPPSLTALLGGVPPLNPSPISGGIGGAASPRGIGGQSCPAPEAWEEAICDLAWKAVSQTQFIPRYLLPPHYFRSQSDEALDNNGWRQHIAIIPAAGGELADTEVIQGVALWQPLTERIPDKTKKLRAVMPRVLLLGGASVGNTASLPRNDGCLDEFVTAYQGWFEKLYDRIRVWNPTVILCEGTMHHFLQERAAADKIMVATLVNRSLLERLERALGGRIVEDLAKVTIGELQECARNSALSPVGRATEMTIEFINDQPLMIFSGLGRPTFSSILLRGAHAKALSVVAGLLEEAIECAYHLAAVAHFCSDFGIIIGPKSELWRLTQSRLPVDDESMFRGFVDHIRLPNNSKKKRQSNEEQKCANGEQDEEAKAAASLPPSSTIQRQQTAAGSPYIPPLIKITSPSSFGSSSFGAEEKKKGDADEHTQSSQLDPSEIAVAKALIAFGGPSLPSSGSQQQQPLLPFKSKQTQPAAEGDLLDSGGSAAASADMTAHEKAKAAAAAAVVSAAAYLAPVGTGRYSRSVGTAVVSMNIGAHFPKKVLEAAAALNVQNKYLIRDNIVVNVVTLERLGAPIDFEKLMEVSAAAAAYGGHSLSTLSGAGGSASTRGLFSPSSSSDANSNVGGGGGARLITVPFQNTPIPADPRALQLAGIGVGGASSAYSGNAAGSGIPAVTQREHLFDDKEYYNPEAVRDAKQDRASFTFYSAQGGDETLLELLQEAATSVANYTKLFLHERRRIVMRVMHEIVHPAERDLAHETFFTPMCYYSCSACERILRQANKGMVGLLDTDDEEYNMYSFYKSVSDKRPVSTHTLHMSVGALLELMLYANPKPRRNNHGTTNEGEKSKKKNKEKGSSSRYSLGELNEMLLRGDNDDGEHLSSENGNGDNFCDDYEDEDDEYAMPTATSSTLFNNNHHHHSCGEHHHYHRHQQPDGMFSLFCGHEMFVDIRPCFEIVAPHRRSAALVSFAVESIDVNVLVGPSMFIARDTRFQRQAAAAFMREAKRRMRHARREEQRMILFEKRQKQKQQLLLEQRQEEQSQIAAKQQQQHHKNTEEDTTTTTCASPVGGKGNSSMTSRQYVSLSPQLAVSPLRNRRRRQTKEGRASSSSVDVDEGRDHSGTASSSSSALSSSSSSLFSSSSSSSNSSESEDEERYNGLRVRDDEDSNRSYDTNDGDELQGGGGAGGLPSASPSPARPRGGVGKTNTILLAGEKIGTDLAYGKRKKRPAARDPTALTLANELRRRHYRHQRKQQLQQSITEAFWEELGAAALDLDALGLVPKYLTDHGFATADDVADFSVMGFAIGDNNVVAAGQEGDEDEDEVDVVYGDEEEVWR